ncbi:hypothetical protein KFK09_020078 [Dendrobium nobile]|uniref:Secreted protein n=1 Tax=Dendrobium nobile TaxID=94219 RepID=A0A8T3ARB1_DENNO|nr:hypothetical protein KFK09_020078 [Dendrobium nobile]
MIAMLQISLLIIVVALSLSPTFGNEFGEHRPEEIKLQHGAVATDDRRCSRNGRAVLKEGGHAVDATVASVLCLGVVSSASSGIGNKKKTMATFKDQSRLTRIKSLR